jgi:16S rRNA processing protein RimM
MAPISPDSLFLVGRCGRAHGVRGEVKVFPGSGDSALLEGLDRVFVGPSPEEARAHAVMRVRLQPQKGRTVVLLLLGDVPSREDAEALTGLYVYAAEEDLPPLERGEVYVHDLIGLAVVRVDEDGIGVETVGTVRDVLEGGAQLLLVVARDGAPDVLVPDVPEIVLDIDVPAGRILVDPPEGLFE